MYTKPLIIAAIAAVTGLSVTACSPAQRAENLPPGKYESNTRSVDSHGTAYETKKTTNVEVDEHGNKDATVETETSKDPKGLFNKSTSKTKSTSSTDKY